MSAAGVSFADVVEHADSEQNSARSENSLPLAAQGRRMGVSTHSLAGYSGGSKPSFFKTDLERQELMDLIMNSRDSKIHIMLDNVPAQTLQEIIDAMFRKSITEREVIIKEGDPGGIIYIVKTGSFDILEPPRVEPGEHATEAYVRQPTKIYEAAVGYSFGEHVGQGMVRSGSIVVAREDSEVWCLELDVFRMIVVSSAEAQFQANRAFLKGCDILSDLTEDQIAALAEVVMEEDFENNEAIVEQDDRDTNMFILREGEAIAVMSGPQGDVEVAKYGPGDYFGEIALLLGKARQATVYANEHTRCIYFSREVFNRLLGPLRDILSNNIEKYRKYQQLMEDDGGFGICQNRSVQSTPRQMREVYDGTWEKYKIRGQAFNFRKKGIARTFAKLPDIGFEKEEEGEEAAQVVKKDAEPEPKSLKEKVERDFQQAVLVSPNDAFTIPNCAIQAFGGLVLGQHFTQDKVLITRPSMMPQQEGFEDHYSWSAPTWTKGCTQIAALCQKGHKSADDPTPNQDNFFILHIGLIQVYGVADGHGPFGHLVSFRLVQTLPHFLVNSQHFGKDWEMALREAFLSAQSDLVKFADDNHVNIEASGAAGSIVVFEGPAVHIAHIGDAGAMVASWNRRDSRFITGTQDHKPQFPAERERLEAAGSEVREVDEDSFRIYRKGTTFPGLTMSRAFGDTACAGVLQEPEYQKLLLQPSDEIYAVIASDGIWEFLNYEKTVELSAKKLRIKGPDETARFLVEASRKRWKLAAGEYCDDITIIVVQWNVSAKQAQADSNFRLTLKRPVEEA